MTAIAGQSQAAAHPVGHQRLCRDLRIPAARLGKLRGPTWAQEIDGHRTADLRRGFAACGFATTSLLLNVARAAQGLGGAFLLTASLAIIGNTFKGAERTRAFALLGGEPWHRPGHTSASGRPTRTCR